MQTLSVSIPLTQTERTDFDKFLFQTGMKKGFFLRKVILDAIKENEEKEAENAKK
jgi:hypothetical protein